MKAISIIIICFLAITVGVNLYALFSKNSGAYVFWCNIVTGSSLLAVMLLIMVRKKKLKKLQQDFIDRFFSRN
ncbi:hypothetical protein G7092_02555 [Mucilaginibacter sp. HC2]|uniref:hypothetical protein n=1 Tax=Mucilaginibacter inviolabilis TaxID=2714892 RepID=UPI001408A724|nr:hypothetical protein [Mucilaginibacter inviolabilis]NHA02657.1 hypothetical protein [Mucilaginibacter inviolabilis]